MGVTTQTAQLPDYAKPYVQDMLAQTQAYTDVNANPYQQYGGERVAGFTGLQNQAFQSAQNMQPSAYGEQGAGIAGLAAGQALAAGQNFQPGQFANQFNAPDQYQAGQFGTQSFAQPGAAGAYMSPYMQNVVDVQKREAARQSGIQGTQQQAQATQAGAFGGSRDAIMRAERERNLGQQMGDIQATGSQAAYQQAQQQFNAEQAARQQAAQLGEQSRQFGAGQGMTAAQQAAQYGQAATQLGEQSRQYGAGLGLQGANTALQGASTLGTLGNQQFGQQKDISGMQYLYGAAQQQNQQQQNDVNYQNFQAAQNYPKEMLSFRSNMLNGLPMGSTSTSTPEPSAMSQGIGLLGAIGSFFKKGGAVADGGEPGLMALMASRYARG